jgi:hypothetical protein
VPSESLFPQLHFGEPSSGFTPGLGSASLFLLPNNVLAKRINVNINGRLVVEYNHLLLLLASRLIFVVTCLPGLS